MAEEYQAKVPIQPITPEAGGQAAAESITKLSNAFMEEVQKYGVEKARQEGAIAGQDINFKPAAGGQAAQAYNQAALEANRYAIGGQVFDKVSKLYYEVSKNPDPEKALLDFSAGVKGFQDGLLENVPAQNQAYARNILTHQVERAQMQLMSREVKAQRAQRYLFGLSSVDDYIHQMNSVAAGGDLAGAATYRNDAVNLIKTMVGAGAMNPTAAETHLKRISNDFRIGYALGDYHTNKAYDAANGTNKAADWEKSFLSSKSYTPKEKKQVFSYIDSENKREAQANGVTAKNYDYRVKNIIQNVQTTGQVNSEELNFLHDAKPKDFPDVERKINNAKQVYDNSSIPKTVGDISGKIAELKTTVPKTEDEKEINAASISMLKTKLNEIVSDPIGYAQNDPVYQEMLKNPVLLNAHKDDPNEIKVLYMQQAGLQPSQYQMLPTQENAKDIETINGFISNNEADKAFAYLKTREQQFPKTFNYYLNGVVQTKKRAGIPLWMETLLDMSNNPRSLPALRDAMTALNTPEKVLTANLSASETGQEAKKADVQTAMSSNNDIIDFQNSFQSYSTQSDDLLNNFNTSVEKLAYHYIATKGMSAKKAVSMAFDTLYGNNYNYIGSDYRVRIGQDPSTVRTAMQFIDNHVREKNLPPIKGFEDSYLNLAFKKHFSIRNAYDLGHWINDPADDNNYMKVDVHGYPIHTPNGFDLFGVHINRPYLTITKEDLQNPTLLAELMSRQVLPDYGRL